MFTSGKKEIWAIGGGKGGVGKSIISSNLAITLAQKGHEVAIIDADFGGSNLHTCFGLGAPSASVSDFLESQSNQLEDFLVPTPYSKIRLASGAQDSLKMANPKTFQQAKLSKAIDALDAEYILVDLGAGTHSFTIDLFLKADKGIVVTMPEPTSIENTYRFLKYAFYRKLKKIIHHPGVKAYLESITAGTQAEGPTNPAELLQKINDISRDAGEILSREIASFCPKIVLNQVRSSKDIRIGFSMQNACLKYFGIRTDYVGFVESDDSVLQSVRMRKPVLISEPFARSSRCIKKISENLVNNSQIVTAVL